MLDTLKKRWPVLLLAAALLLALFARTSEPSSEAFCAAANDFVTSPQTRLVTTPDASVFEAIDTELAELDELASSDQRDTVKDLRDGFAAISEAYAAVGFDPEGTIQLPASVQETSNEASRDLTNHLTDECGLSEVRADQIVDIQTAFGIDDESLAQCLHTQLGNVANIDAASLTPQLMTTEVCDTTILALLSGDT